MSPVRNQPGSWTEIRLGARAHNNRQRQTIPAAAVVAAGEGSSETNTHFTSEGPTCLPDRTDFDSEGLTRPDRTDKEQQSTRRRQTGRSGALSPRESSARWRRQGESARPPAQPRTSGSGQNEQSGRCGPNCAFIFGELVGTSDRDRWVHAKGTASSPLRVAVASPDGAAVERSGPAAVQVCELVTVRGGGHRRRWAPRAPRPRASRCVSSSPRWTCWWRGARTCPLGLALSCFGIATRTLTVCAGR